MAIQSHPSFSVIFAGEDRSIKFLDGTQATIRVRAMPVRHLGRVLQLADREAELLDFVCYLPREGGGYDAVPEGWADNLSPESHLELYEAAKRLNFSNAVAWADRQITAKQMTGELAVKVDEMMAPLIRRAAASLDSSPKPSRSPAEATTRS